MAAQIHLFVGEDDWSLDEAAKKVVARALADVAPENRVSAVEIVDGDRPNMDLQLESIRDCEASVTTPPFLDPVKVTWWKNVSFFPSGGNAKLAEDVKTALEEFLGRLAKSPMPENQFFVVTAPRLLKTSICAKLFKGMAEVVEFAAAKRASDKLDAALDRLPELAAAEGLVFAPDAARAFIARAGADTRTIVSELAKMRAYLGPDAKEATAEDVAQITSIGPGETEPWDVTNAVGERNAAAARQALAKFAVKPGWGVFMSVILEKFFRELVVYRDAVDRGWLGPYGWKKGLPAEAVRALDEAGVGPGVSKNNWACCRGARQAANWTLRELRVARARMCAVREKVVSGADDGLVETELLRIMMKGK